MLNRVKEFKQVSDALQKEYLDYIRNKSISLDERWEVYLAAPSDWKGNLSYLYYFKFEMLLKNKEIYWYDDFYYERYQTIDIPFWISEEIDEFLEEYENRDELLQIIKEEILETNIGSFVYDW